LLLTVLKEEEDEDFIFHNTCRNKYIPVHTHIWQIQCGRLLEKP